jgi:hypothetical protein
MVFIKIKADIDNMLIKCGGHACGEIYGVGNFNYKWCNCDECNSSCE